ncbi:MAG: hypothetical protein HYS27_03505 [Deltaproteobacteria bacterium]|nr:hypothetical protein [Deltaproteobacteria bacterium]
MTHARLVVVMAVLGAAACPDPPVFQVVDCRMAWHCGDDEVASEDDGEEDLCLDVADADRQATIDEHQVELQSDCNAVAVNCIGGERAVCTATCTSTSVVCGTDAGD